METATPSIVHLAYCAVLQSVKPAIDNLTHRSSEFCGICRPVTSDDAKGASNHDFQEDASNMEFSEARSESQSKATSTRPKSKTRNRFSSRFNRIRNQWNSIKNDYHSTPSWRNLNFSNHCQSIVLCDSRSSESLYDTLGVPRSANEDQIRKAYKKLAVQHHPDKPSGDSEKFKKISHAYEVLSDKQKKNLYDATGDDGSGPMGGGGGGPGGMGGFHRQGGSADPFGPGGPFSGHGGPFGGGNGPFGGGGGDPFAGFNPFSGQNGGGAGGFSDGMDSGGDPFDVFSRMGAFGEKVVRKPGAIVIPLNVTLEDLCLSRKKTVSLSNLRNLVCKSCKGKGGKFGICSNCNGQGMQTTVRQFGNGYMQSSSQCGVCGGHGQVLVEECKTCRGMGKVSDNGSHSGNQGSGGTNISISLNSLCEHGQLFEFPGRGHEAIRGDGRILYGDVHVVLNLVQANAGGNEDGIRENNYTSSTSTRTLNTNTNSKYRFPIYDLSRSINLERGPSGSLFGKIDLTFPDAVCGKCLIQMKHPSGRILKIELPPLIQGNDIIQIPKEGLAKTSRGGSSSSNSNDLYLRINVQPPKKVPWDTDVERERLRGILSGERRFNEQADEAGGSGGGGSASSSDTNGANSTNDIKSQSSNSSSSPSSFFQNITNKVSNTIGAATGRAPPSDYESDGLKNNNIDLEKDPSIIRVKQPLPEHEKMKLTQGLRSYKEIREKKRREALGIGMNRNDDNDGGGCQVQ